MATVPQIVSALNRERQWLMKQRDAKPTHGTTVRKNRLVQCCITILRRSPQNYNGWARRNDRVKKIRDQNGTWTRRANHRAVVQLVELALSDVEANRLFQDDVEAGNLVADLSSAKRDALAKASAARDRRHRLRRIAAHNT